MGRAVEIERPGGRFGVAHAVLLFPGDILTVYAVLGLVLLPNSPASRRR